MTTRRSSHLTSLPDAVAALCRPPFPCPNCDTPTTGDLFCSELCREQAKFVRYFRGCILDRRHEQEDVKRALQTRLALIVGGGYGAKERLLSKEVRTAVVERDDHRCRLCGAPGQEIDHIRGNGNELENVQLLCAECHHRKTQANIRKTTDPTKLAIARGLLQRVGSPRPLKLCDDAEWNAMHVVVRRERRLALQRA